jgi:hypothetical protein
VASVPPSAATLRHLDDKGAPADASAVSIATRNNSGFSITTVSPPGAPVSESANLIVTVVTGCPGDSRRLRATAGCGGLISTLTATAGMAFSTSPNDVNCSPASGSSSESAPSAGASCRYAVDTAAGSPAADQTQRTTRIGAPVGRPSAQATSCGASRRDTCRDWQVIAPPMGSRRVVSPPVPSMGIQ